MLFSIAFMLDIIPTLILVLFFAAFVLLIEWLFTDRSEEEWEKDLKRVKEELGEI
jgi:hypothetical protein